MSENKRTFTEAGSKFAVMNISHKFYYFCHGALVRATFVQTSQLVERAQTCDFYNCVHINQSHSHGSLLTYLFIGIHFINLKNLWCAHLPCHFEVPRGIYNIHRWLAVAGQVEWIKAPQCHKTPRCGQLDQASKIWQNDLCQKCLYCGDAAWMYTCFWADGLKVFTDNKSVHWEEGLFAVNTKMNWIHKSVFISWRLLH